MSRKRLATDQKILRVPLQSLSSKNRYHAAARKWVQKAIGAGLLSIADLKAAEASCTMRGVAEAGKTVILYPLSESLESPCEPTSEGT